MIFATVASGFSVSSALTLERADRPVALFVPSMTGNAVRLGFATVSGGAGASSFGAIYTQGDLDAVVSSSTTRPAWGIVPHPPTPWCRVQLGANVTDTLSFALAAVL